MTYADQQMAFDRRAIENHIPDFAARLADLASGPEDAFPNLWANGLRHSSPREVAEVLWFATLAADGREEEALQRLGLTRGLRKAVPESVTSRLPEHGTALQRAVRTELQLLWLLEHWGNPARWLGQVDPAARAHRVSHARRHNLPEPIERYRGIARREIARENAAAWIEVDEVVTVLFENAGLDAPTSRLQSIARFEVQARIRDRQRHRRRFKIVGLGPTNEISIAAARPYDEVPSTLRPALAAALAKQPPWWLPQARSCLADGAAAARAFLLRLADLAPPTDALRHARQQDVRPVPGLGTQACAELTHLVIDHERAVLGRIQPSSIAAIVHHAPQCEACLQAFHTKLSFAVPLATTEGTHTLRWFPSTPCLDAIIELAAAQAPAAAAHRAGVLQLAQAEDARNLLVTWRERQLVAYFGSIGLPHQALKDWLAGRLSLYEFAQSALRSVQAGAGDARVVFGAHRDASQTLARLVATGVPSALSGMRAVGDIVPVYATALTDPQAHGFAAAGWELAGKSRIQRPIYFTELRLPA